MTNMKSDILCRMARAEDDVRAIARCIYETDPYIYPTAFCASDAPDWITVVDTALSAKGNVFARENVAVAILDGEIVGVLCTLAGGVRYTFLEDLPASIAMQKGLALAHKGYFSPLIEETFAMDGYNVSNLCIDHRYRGLGIGKALLSFGIEKYGDEKIYLDVIAANTPAVSLYQRLGFDVVKSYYGFSGSEAPLPCYQMCRVPTKNKGEDHESLNCH